MSRAEHQRSSGRPGRLRGLPALVAALLVGVLLYATMQPVGAASLQDPPAQDTAQDQGHSGCGNLPVISEACSQLLDGAAWAVNCGLNGVSDCAGDVTDTVVAGAFDYFARWVAVGAIGATDLVWSGITSTTTPVVDSGTSVFQTSMVAAQAMALPLLILAALYSLLKRDAEIAVKSAFLYLPGAVLGMVVAGYVLTALLAATDELGAIYLTDGENGVATWLDQLSGSIAAGIGVTAPILLVVFSAIVMIGSLLLWMVMLFRSVAILVTYAFMPLAFAALIFPATRSWIRRLIEIQLSFVLAKPVILATLSLGAATLNDQNNALANMMQAAALFYLAAFTPFALMKLIPFVQHEAMAAMESPARSPHAWVVGTAAGVFTGQRLASFIAGSQQSPPAASASPGGGAPIGTPPGTGGSGGGGSGGGSGGGDGGPAGSGPSGGSDPPGSGYGGGGSTRSPSGGGSSGGTMASGSAAPPVSGQSGQ